MAKYGSGLSSQEVCELECTECLGILKKYGVSTEDTETITGMINQAYYLLDQSYKSSRYLEAHMKDVLGEKKYNRFIKSFMKHITGRIKSGKHLTAELAKDRPHLVAIK